MQPSSTYREPGDLPISAANSSAVSWAAIWAGAFAAASLTLILVILGSGAGLLSSSPITHTGATAATLSVATVIWLIFTQWFASGLGGYIAGRMRTKYVSVHTDEVFFRDTAHGFLAWAVATIVIAALSFSAITSGISGGAHMLGFAAGAGKPGMERPMAPPPGPMAGPMDHNMYVLDALFRSDHPPVNGDDHEVRGEVMRIFATGLKNGDVLPEDKSYLSQVVAARTGISQPDAAKRVDDTITQMKTSESQAKDAAEAARKAAATLSIFTALSMFVGAFIGSVAGALGGKRRDEY